MIRNNENDTPAFNFGCGRIEDKCTFHTRLRIHAQPQSFSLSDTTMSGTTWPFEGSMTMISVPERPYFNLVINVSIR
jgi:hypothetical protein